MVPYKDLFIALDKSDVRYLVAGGFAVNFHHINRATADLDVVVHLTEENIIAFDKVMTELGYRPRLPVTGKEFAKKENRDIWINEKNMVVFSYIHPKNFFELIDVFVEEPMPFESLYQNRLVVEAFGVTIPVVGIDDLITMKQNTGRDKDLFDANMLRKKKNEL
ncbi:MAG: hypothetical protein HQM16_15770 [Deltaproteobacteria bacterium]|nr:hypothetical protein [Deltaproteobacteria bacterium]